MGGAWTFMMPIILLAQQFTHLNEWYYNSLQTELNLFKYHCAPIVQNCNCTKCDADLYALQGVDLGEGAFPSYWHDTVR